MADLSITPTDVDVVTSTSGSFVQFGETITPGQSVYRSTADNKFYKADCTASATARIAGIAISYASANTYGYIFSQTGGKLNLGVTLSKGEIYVVSDTAGGIMPITDLTTGQYFSQIGIAETTSNLQMRMWDSQITHA